MGHYFLKNPMRHALFFFFFFRFLGRFLLRKVNKFSFFRSYFFLSLVSLFFHFQIPKKKKRNFDAAHFLDARGDEKQMSKLERPYPGQPKMGRILTLRVMGSSLKN